MWFKLWFQVWNESDRITHRGDLFFKYCTFEFNLLFAQGFFLLLFSGKTAPPPSKKPVGRPPQISQSFPCAWVNSSKHRENPKQRSGRPITYLLEVKNDLIQWILELRDLHYPVSVLALKEKAKGVIQPHNPDFNASPHQRLVIISYLSQPDRTGLIGLKRHFKLFQMTRIW